MQIVWEFWKHNFFKQNYIQIQNISKYKYTWNSIRLRLVQNLKAHILSHIIRKLYKITFGLKTILGVGIAAKKLHRF